MPRGYEVLENEDDLQNLQTAVPVTDADAEAVDVVDVQVELAVPAAEQQQQTPAQQPGAFHLRVKQANTGATLDVALPSAAATVARLKARLEELTAVPARRQRLIHRGRMLQDPEVLGTVKALKSGTTVHLVPMPAPDGAGGALGPAPVSDDEDGDDADVDADGLGRAERARREQARRALAGMTLWGEAGGPGDAPVPAGARGRALHVWRARIRLLSSVLFFFYIMSLLSFVALWMQPGRRQKLAELAAKAAGKEADPATVERFVKRQEVRQLLDMLTSVVGVSAGSLGIKAAATLDVRLAKRFRSALSVVAMCSVGQAALDVADVMHGGAVAAAAYSRAAAGGRQVSHNSLVTSMVSGLLLASGIWMSCVWCSHAFLRQLDQTNGAGAGGGRVRRSGRTHGRRAGAADPRNGGIELAMV